MNWRNPDVELHATGWPAVLLTVAIVIASINAMVDLYLRLVQ